jgi:hypothetical protein
LEKFEERSLRVGGSWREVGEKFEEVKGQRGGRHYRGQYTPPTTKGTLASRQRLFNFVIRFSLDKWLAITIYH